MRSKEDFFSEFYYPDEIVADNEGNVKVLSISRACFTVKFQTSGWNFWFMDLAQRLGP